MVNAVLHIGASKCGSSALQKFLSLNKEKLAGNNKNYRYTVIDKEGHIRTGAAILRRAQASAHGYVSSTGAGAIVKLMKSDLAGLKRKLRASIGNADPILSYEGWYFEHQAFDRRNILPELGITAHVVFYVRPQVEFMNSAWWQWGAWMNKPFDEWFSWQLGRVRWAQYVHAWKQVTGVEKVTVRLLPENIVTDFKDLLGISCTDTDVTVSNKSLPGVLLRVMQRNPELRSDAHFSRIDFILDEHFRDLTGQTPWVLNEGNVELILNTTRASNAELLSLLEDDQKELFRGDSRWWKANCYANRTAESPTPQPSPDPELERYLVRALQIISSRN